MSTWTIKKVYDDEDTVTDEFVEVREEHNGIGCVEIIYVLGADRQDSIVLNPKMAKEVAKAIVEIANLLED